jgi:hypothetical protein
MMEFLMFCLITAATARHDLAALCEKLKNYLYKYLET